MIRPGATLGLLGGGQLGRMIALAAAPLGLKVNVFAPDADSPAFDVCHARTCARFDDEEALARFARACDVVTYEFENVPRRAAEIVAAVGKLRPNAAALAVTQDRLSEKTFVAECGLPTAPFRSVTDEADLSRAAAELGRPAVLKTRRFGYDGKGQVMLREDTDLAGAFAALSRAPSILEGFVPFSREISVVAARGVDGAFAAWEPVENVHEHHILAVSRVPAGLAPATADGWWSTRSPRACTTPGTGPSRERTPPSSSSTCAPCAAGRWARRRAAAPWRCAISSAPMSSAGRTFSANPAPISTSTARARPAPAARWGTSRGWVPGLQAPETRGHAPYPLVELALPSRRLGRAGLAQGRDQGRPALVAEAPPGRRVDTAFRNLHDHLHDEIRDGLAVFGQDRRHPLLESRELGRFERHSLGVTNLRVAERLLRQRGRDDTRLFDAGRR